jgi:hypothetical protein
MRGIGTKQTIAVAAALAALSFTSNAGQPTLKPLSFRAEARVEVDEAGKLVKVEASKDLPEAVRRYLEQQLSTWKYVRHDRTQGGGNAATWVSLGACAVPKADGTYALGLAYFGNGPRIADGGNWKVTSELAMQVGRQQLSGEARVHFTVNADGTAKFESFEFPRQDARLRKALANFVQGQRFDPEELDGHPVTTRETLPVRFRSGFDAPDTQAERLAEAMTSPQCRTAELLATEAMRPGMAAVAVDSVISIEPKI